MFIRRWVLIYSSLIAIVLVVSIWLGAPDFWAEYFVGVVNPIRVQPLSASFVTEFEPASLLPPFHDTKTGIEFNPELLDQPDDPVLLNADSGSGGSVADTFALEFPSQHRWPASLLHRLKKRIKIEPEVEGRWFVLSSGQKLIFVPELSAWQTGKISPESVFRIVLPKRHKHYFQSKWYIIEPFSLELRTPPCRLDVQLDPMFSLAPPLSLHARIKIEGTYALEKSKLNNAFRAELEEQSKMRLLQLQNENTSSKRLDFRSESIPLKKGMIFRVSVEDGHLMQNLACRTGKSSTVLSSDVVLQQFTVLSAGGSLSKRSNTVWPEYHLQLNFNLPVHAEDIMNGLDIKSNAGRKVQLRLLSGGTQFGSQLEFILLATEYHPQLLRLKLKSKSLPRTPLQFSQDLEFPLVALPDGKAECPYGQTLYERLNLGRRLLVCGSKSERKELYNNVSLWTTGEKKDSPSFRWAMQGPASNLHICLSQNGQEVLIGSDTTKSPIRETAQASGSLTIGHRCDLKKIVCNGPIEFDLKNDCGRKI